jgi:hypothetical protein
MRRGAWALVLAVAVVAATGVPGAGAATKKPAKASSAADLAHVMSARGITCAAFVDSPDSPDSSGTALPGAPVGDTGECLVDGATASLAVYDSPRELARALAAMPVLCRFAVAVLGPVEFTFVTGRNWSISFFSREYDPAVGKALGAETRDVDCAKYAGG